MTEELRLLIADDHQILRNGIKLMLSQQSSFIPIVDEADNGKDVIKLATKNDYDIILLDINMPKKDGLTVARQLMAKNKNIRILVLTIYKEDYIIKQMISAGVRGYLLKNASLEELTKAVLTIHNGGRYYCNEIAQTLIHESAQTKKYKSSEFIIFDSSLTHREKEVLCLIANEYTNPEIAERLAVSKRTVDTHRTNIINKLKIRNTAGLVKYAVEKGII